MLIRPIVKRLSKHKSTCYLMLILGTSLFIGLFQVSNSGVQWPEDGSRYLNNGALIHDYLKSGDYFHPYEFSKKNYRQFPGFSLPYHPPGYAFFLGVWFIIFGMSFESARFFISCLLGVMGCFFFKILQKQQISENASLCASLAMITSHEVIRWGRSTMSEIPALAFLMVGSYLFIKYVDSKEDKWSYAAFAFALTAFFCRVLSAGIIPAWVLYLWYKNGFKKLFSKCILLPTTIFLIVGFFWSKFASSFAQKEIQSGIVENLSSFFTYTNLTVWLKALPSMTGKLILLLAVSGIVVSILYQKRKLLVFWAFWFLSYYVFMILLSRHFESRYFIFAVPALFALASANLMPVKYSIVRKISTIIIILLIMAINYFYFSILPKGVTGHKFTALELVKQKEPGNILLSCWNDADLIFRYRSHDQTSKRQMIRGDRTLAVRLPDYAGEDSKTIAKTFDDVISIIKKGRIKYIVTSSSKFDSYDNRPEDMIIAHDTMISNPDLFTLLWASQLEFDFENKRYAKIYLWRYNYSLEGTESKLPIRIPTANIIY